MALPLLGRWLYRSRQFFSALGLGGSISRDEMAQARDVLGLRLYGLFAAMPASYRRHGYNVYKKVKAAGGSDPALLQAALLHDSGKFEPESGRYVTVGHRVVVVLLEALPLGRPLLARLSTGHVRRGPAGYLLYPFYLGMCHPSLGARRAERAGASPEAVRLIRHHQHHGTEKDESLRLLQAADDRS